MTVLLDGEQGTVTVDPDPAEAEARVARGPRRRRGAGRLRRAGHHAATGTPCRCWPTCRTAPGRARPSPRTRRASACSAPSCPSSGTRRSPTVEEQAAGYAEVLRGLRGAQGRAPHPGRRLGQAAGLRHAAGRGQPGTGGPRPAHRPARPRTCSTASWTPSPRPPGGPRRRPWVMAPDGGHRRGGGRLRRPGARPRARAGRDDRGALGGAARRPAARARRLPVDRHQRPVAVHARRRPAVGRPGRPHRPVAAGAPAAGRA